jgi:hypothetical protein
MARQPNPSDYIVEHIADAEGNPRCGVARRRRDRAGIGLACPFCAGATNAYDLWGELPRTFEEPLPQLEYQVVFTEHRPLPAPSKNPIARRGRKRGYNTR